MEHHLPHKNIFKVFERGISPILRDARETTDEPIQQEPYLPLLRLLADDYKTLIAKKHELFGESTDKPIYELFQFQLILMQTFSYMDEDLITKFLVEGEGPTNVFNFLLLENLTDLLKRTDIDRENKTLAIKRYLDAASSSFRN